MNSEYIRELHEMLTEKERSDMPEHVLGIHRYLTFIYFEVVDESFRFSKNLPSVIISHEHFCSIVGKAYTGFLNKFVTE